MKVKFSVIPFIPAAIAMLVFRLMSVFGADESGNFLGMDKMAVSYTVIGIALGLFVLCILINIFDRKTAPVYPVKKNIPAGVLAILSGVSVIAGSVSTLLANNLDSEYYIMTLIAAVFSVPAGIALMLMSRVHFSGKSVVSGVSMLFVFPALWGCAQLVYEFLSATKVSISASDLTGLFCYIFLTLYLFSHSMVVSRIKGRNPVKSCFIYGLPAAALGISHGIYSFLIAAQEGTGYETVLVAAQFVILALYALSFIVEMTTNSFTKDELEIIDGLPSEENEEEEEKYIETKSYDDLVFSDRSADNDRNADPEDDYYSSASGLDDFIIGYKHDDDDKEPIPYLTKEEMKKATDSGIVYPKKTEPEENLEKPLTSKPEETPEASEPVKPEAQPAKEENESASDVQALLRDIDEKSADTVKAEPEPVVEKAAKPAEKTEPEPEKEEELSEIDKLLRELDSKA